MVSRLQNSAIAHTDLGPKVLLCLLLPEQTLTLAFRVNVRVVVIVL